jgi:hypothetical protein
MYAALIGGAILTLTGIPANADGFQSFSDESFKIETTISCRFPKVTKTPGLPDMWGCIHPGAEVVKVFVNAAEDNQSVSNIKIMWNDWTKNIGHGVHTDQDIARDWLEKLLPLYDSDQTDQVIEAFFGKQDREFQTESAIIQYTYWKGPAIDERLITLTPR